MCTTCSPRRPVRRKSGTFLPCNGCQRYSMTTGHDRHAECRLIREAFACLVIPRPTVCPNQCNRSSVTDWRGCGCRADPDAMGTVLHLSSSWRELAGREVPVHLPHRLFPHPRGADRNRIWLGRYPELDNTCAFRLDSCARPPRTEVRGIELRLDQDSAKLKFPRRRVRVPCRSLNHRGLCQMIAAAGGARAYTCAADHGAS